MFKRLVIFAVLVASIFAGSQFIETDTASASITYKNVEIDERSIEVINNGIEVMINNEYASYLMRFEKRNGEWWSGTSTNARNFKGWKPVSSDQFSNDVLYIVLQNM